MWSYVLGTLSKSTNTLATKYVEQLDAWVANNSKIITWINSCIEHSIGIQLEKYETAQEVWAHLARLYTQSNFAKHIQLESNIRALDQKDISIQEFILPCLIFGISWPSQNLQSCQQRLVRFFMALCDDYEGLCGLILHRSPLPSIDSVINELLTAEIRLKSQAAGKGILPTPNQFVFEVLFRPYIFQLSVEVLHKGWR